MTRSEEIRNAVKESIRKIDHWLVNILPSDSRILPDSIVNAIKLAVMICQSGDIPQEMRQLCTVCMPKLGEELNQYLRRAEGSMQPNGQVAPPFWRAAREVAELLHKSEVVTVEQIEPVHALLEQKVTREQIAREIYGKRGVGVFMLPNGQVNYMLLEKEAKEPGSVIDENWVHPSCQNFVKAAEAELQARVDAYKKLEAGPRRYEDPATIEEMLLQNCFVQQIERGKNVTREEVLAVADRIGVKPCDGPEYRRPIPLMKQSHAEPPVIHSESTPSLNPDPSPAASDQGLYDAIVSVFEGNPTFGTPEIVAQLKEEGIQVTGQKVGAVIRQHKSQEKSNV